MLLLIQSNEKKLLSNNYSSNFNILKPRRIRNSISNNKKISTIGPQRKFCSIGPRDSIIGGCFKVKEAPFPIYACFRFSRKNKEKEKMFENSFLLKLWHASGFFRLENCFCVLHVILNLHVYVIGG